MGIVGTEWNTELDSLRKNLKSELKIVCQTNDCSGSMSYALSAQLFPPLHCLSISIS